jgi:hypothetical protein
VTTARVPAKAAGLSLESGGSPTLLTPTHAGTFRLVGQPGWSAQFETLAGHGVRLVIEQPGESLLLTRRQ